MRNSKSREYPSVPDSIKKTAHQQQLFQSRSDSRKALKNATQVAQAVPNQRLIFRLLKPFKLQQYAQVSFIVLSEHSETGRHGLRRRLLQADDAECVQTAGPGGAAGSPAGAPDQASGPVQKD
jgi:hypothetical protein